jgi:twitching motility protein PilI
MANKEALRELQGRLAERLKQVRETAPTRNWLAVEACGHGFLLPLDQAGEIFSLVALQRVPHSQPWFLGVGNLRGQLHGVVDLATFIGMTRRPTLTDPTSKEAGRLVALNASLQLNSALLIDRLAGLRRPDDLTAVGAIGARPHFVVAQYQDAKGRLWSELDLVALASDEAFLKVAA